MKIKLINYSISRYEASIQIWNSDSCNTHVSSKAENYLAVPKTLSHNFGKFSFRLRAINWTSIAQTIKLLPLWLFIADGALWGQELYCTLTNIFFISILLILHSVKNSFKLCSLSLQQKVHHSFVMINLKSVVSSIDWIEVICLNECRIQAFYWIFKAKLTIHYQKP